MKTLINLIIILCLSYTSQAQFKKIENKQTVGLVLTTGGTAITLAGFLTPADVYWVPDPNGSLYNTAVQQQGNWVKQPFYNQGPRAYAITGGAVFTITGLITLASKKR